MEPCDVCGEELDHQAVTVTLTFAPGQHGERRYRSVPWRRDDWRICWACLSSEKGLALRKALEDEYTEPVIEQPHIACHTVCAGTRAVTKGRLRSFLSVRQGSRGEPEEWARCPVCFGPCEVERAA
jgi:hypothetical protein